MSRHDDLIRIRHMRDHSREAVMMASGRSQEDFRSDRMVVLAMTRLVEIVGEAASKVSPQTQAAIPQVPWPDIIGMRNRIVHGYDRVNLKILWDTIVVDLPPLISQLEAAIERLESERGK